MTILEVVATSSSPKEQPCVSFSSFAIVSPTHHGANLSPFFIQVRHFSVVIQPQNTRLTNCLHLPTEV